MYAVFRSGGKQYRASKGERLKLEKLEADEGANVSFDEVLLVGEGKSVKVGTPLLTGSSVSAKVLKQGKSKKVSVVKFRRRQNYLRQHTHRQWFTEVEITDIKSGGKAAPKADKEEKAEAPKEAATKKPAAKEKRTVKTLKIHAAAEPDPALRYRFWPAPELRQKGNPMPFINRAVLISVNARHAHDEGNQFIVRIAVWRFIDQADSPGFEAVQLRLDIIDF